MQTFITDHPAVGWGVENLDQKRLVKQLLECRQIMAALAGETKGWIHHPATKMWRGKEDLLLDYIQDVSYEMDSREYKWENNLRAAQDSYIKIEIDPTRSMTGWFRLREIDKIIYTHRGRLFEKDPEHYSQWSTYTDYKKYVCCNRCNYYWPTHQLQNLTDQQ